MNCLRCLDDGWTPVGTHKHAGAMYEEMGPCDCDAGKLLEFPSPDGKGRSRTGPWGEDGFWRGRPHNLPAPETKVFLSKEENTRRARELMANLGHVAKEMPA